jgi:hypothetical protein
MGKMGAFGHYLVHMVTDFAGDLKKDASLSTMETGAALEACYDATGCSV